VGFRILPYALFLAAACAPEAVRRELRAADAGRADRRASGDAPPGRAPDAVPVSDSGSESGSGPGPGAAAADAGGGGSQADGRLAGDAPRIPAPAADAAPDRARDLAPGAPHAGRKALFVTDAIEVLSAGDAALRARLQARGFTVTLARDSETTAAHAAGKDVVLISNGANPLDLGARLRDVRVAIVCLESYLFDDLGMTGGVLDADYGLAGGQTQLAITNAAHPMAAGLARAVTVSSAPHSIVWGVPGAAAARVATVVGKTDQVTIFGYAAGAMMTGAAAPARRVGWFAGASMSSTLTPDALKLFDAAIDWALM
jgi:hypothetical protein